MSPPPYCTVRQENHSPRTIHISTKSADETDPCGPTPCTQPRGIAYPSNYRNMASCGCTSRLQPQTQQTPQEQQPQVAPPPLMVCGPFEQSPSVSETEQSSYGYGAMGTYAAQPILCNLSPCNTSSTPTTCDSSTLSEAVCSTCHGPCDRFNIPTPSNQPCTHQQPHSRPIQAPCRVGLSSLTGAVGLQPQPPTGFLMTGQCPMANSCLSNTPPSLISSSCNSNPFSPKPQAELATCSCSPKDPCPPNRPETPQPVYQTSGAGPCANTYMTSALPQPRSPPLQPCSTYTAQSQVRPLTPAVGERCAMEHTCISTEFTPPAATSKAEHWIHPSNPRDTLNYSNPLVKTQVPSDTNPNAAACVSSVLGQPCTAPARGGTCPAATSCAAAAFVPQPLAQSSGPAGGPYTSANTCATGAVQQTQSLPADNNGPCSAQQPSAFAGEGTCPTAASCTAAAFTSQPTAQSAGPGSDGTCPTVNTCITSAFGQQQTPPNDAGSCPVASSCVSEAFTSQPTTPVCPISQPPDGGGRGPCPVAVSCVASGFGPQPIAQSAGPGSSGVCARSGNQSQPVPPPLAAGNNAGGPCPMGNNTYNQQFSKPSAPKVCITEPPRTSPCVQQGQSTMRGVPCPVNQKTRSCEQKQQMICDSSCDEEYYSLDSDSSREDCRCNNSKWTKEKSQTPQGSSYSSTVDCSQTDPQNMRRQQIIQLMQQLMSLINLDDEFSSTKKILEDFSSNRNDPCAPRPDSCSMQGNTQQSPKGNADFDIMNRPPCGDICGSAISIDPTPCGNANQSQNRSYGMSTCGSQPKPQSNDNKESTCANIALTKLMAPPRVCNQPCGGGAKGSGKGPQSSVTIYEPQSPCTSNQMPEPPCGKTQPRSGATKGDSGKSCETTCKSSCSKSNIPNPEQAPPYNPCGSGPPSNLNSMYPFPQKRKRGNTTYAAPCGGPFARYNEATSESALSRVCNDEESSIRITFSPNLSRQCGMQGVDPARVPPMSGMNLFIAPNLQCSCLVPMSPNMGNVVPYEISQERHTCTNDEYSLNECQGEQEEYIVNDDLGDALKIEPCGFCEEEFFQDDQDNNEEVLKIMSKACPVPCPCGKTKLLCDYDLEEFLTKPEKPEKGNQGQGVCIQEIKEGVGDGEESGYGNGTECSAQAKEEPCDLCAQFEDTDAQSNPCPTDLSICADTTGDCLEADDEYSDGPERKKCKIANECDCCHCRAMREIKECCLDIAAPPGNQKLNSIELKFFIDSIIMDLEAMEHARRQKNAEQVSCPPPKPPIGPRNSFPVTITDVTDLGTSSLYVKWVIHDCYGIGGYEIYVDGYLTNRYFHCNHEAAVICEVDIASSHKIVLLAIPKNDEKNFSSISCNADKKMDSKTIVRKADTSSKCNSYPKMPSSMWTPSVYMYDPSQKREPKPIIRRSGACVF